MGIGSNEHYMWKFKWASEIKYWLQINFINKYIVGREICRFGDFNRHRYKAKHPKHGELDVRSDYRNQIMVENKLPEVLKLRRDDDNLPLFMTIISASL